MQNTLSPFQVLEKKIERDYIWLFVALVDMSIGLAMPTDNELTLRLGLFMLVTGFVFAVLLLYGIFQSSGIYWDWHAAHLEAYRVETGLDKPAEPSEPTVDLRTQSVLTHKLVIEKHDDDKTETSEITWKEGEQPSREFIVECFNLALSNKDWRVTEGKVSERASLKAPPFPDHDWNDKLSIMERVGVLKKADPRSNAVRIWQAERFPNPNVALEAFGYDPIKISDSPTRPTLPASAPVLAD